MLKSNLMWPYAVLSLKVVIKCGQIPTIMRNKKIAHLPTTLTLDFIVSFFDTPILCHIKSKAFNDVKFK